jgi:hypothetical protein
VFGWITAAGIVVLVWDLLTIGSKETRPMVVPGGRAEAAV